MAWKYTSSSMLYYEFSWTIDNFSSTPDLMRGPSISNTQGFPENLCIQYEYEQRVGYPRLRSVKICLADMNGKDRQLSVSGEISFRNTDNQCIKMNTFPKTSFNRSTCLLRYDYNSGSSTRISKYEVAKEMVLLKNTLLVNGKLSIYGLASSVSSKTEKDEFETTDELLKNLKTMFTSGISTDFTFLFGEKKLKAHKAILLGRSPVFATMFESDMLESNTNEVVIEDADFDVFNCFLKFLYTGVVEDKKWDTVVSLYSLAHKYQVMSLQTVCCQILQRNITIESVYSVLMLSDLHGNADLKSVVKGFIRHNLYQMAGTPEWIELASTKPELVKEVLA